MKRLTFAAALAWAATAHAANYQPITVRDFTIDAASLARTHAHVEITGWYMVAGSLDELYASGEDIAIVKEGYGTPPFIPLLTDRAPRDFRAAMYDCRASGAYYCQITALGQVTRCTISNIAGTYETTCLNVEGGGRYRRTDQAPVLPAQQQTKPISATDAPLNEITTRDPTGGYRIKEYCKRMSGQGSDAQKEEQCKTDEVAAWKRLTALGWLESLDPSVESECTSPPFQGGFVNEEVCLKSKAAHAQ